MRQRALLLAAVTVLASTGLPAQAQVRFVLPAGGYSRPSLYSTPFTYGGYGGYGGYGSLYGSAFGYRGSYFPYAGGYPYGAGIGYRSTVAPLTYGVSPYLNTYGVYDPRFPGGYGAGYPYGGVHPYGTPYGVNPGLQQAGGWVPVASSSGTAPRMRNAFSPAIGLPSAATSNVARISVAVPSDDAEVWFQGVKTSQTGTERLYESPPLKPGSEYTYQIRARWRSGDSYTEQTRSVTVHAGHNLRVEFAPK